MKFSPTIAAFVISGFFLSECGGRGAEEGEVKPIRLAKTVPSIYKNRSDSGLRFSNDTVYNPEGLFSGFLYELGIDGDTLFFGGYFNGVEEGRHFQRYPGGKMREERHYINGRKDGLQRGWWPDGKPRFLFTCYAGEFEGKFEEWSDSGILIKQFHYNSGREEGSQKLWWSNGSMRANYVVRDGRKFGLIGLKLCSNPYDSAVRK